MEKEFKIDEMSCGHCVIAVEKKLNMLDLQSVKVKIGNVKVKYNSEKIDEDKIISSIENAGYKVINTELQ